VSPYPGGHAVFVAVALATHALGAGYASQLLIDATTPQGIPLLFPLPSAHVSLNPGGHAPAATALLLAGCLLPLSLHRVRSGYSIPGS